MPLKELQNSVGNSENLATRPSKTLKESISTQKNENISTQKNVKEYAVNVQVERKNSREKDAQEVNVKNGINISDLTNPKGASENYWKTLAHHRLNALKEAHKETERLKKIRDNLSEELEQLRQRLNEAEKFVEFVQEELLSDDTGIDVNDLSSENESLDSSNHQENNLEDN